MIELTHMARKGLNRYLDELRVSLRGCRSVDISDVERDVMEHIDAELADATAPIDAPKLDVVLRELGSPAQWIPEDELLWWQKILRRLRPGSEDFRLAYLSIALLALGGLLIPLPVVALLCVALSFCFSRAALSMANSPTELGAQRWLTYPVLLVAYGPLLVCLLLWTVPLGILTADAFRYPQQVVEGRMTPRFSYEIIAAYMVPTLTLVWWTILAILVWVWPGAFHGVFYPFADAITGRRAFVVGVLCLILALLLVSGGSWVLLATTAAA